MIRNLLIPAVCALLLAACGGGGGDDAAPAPIPDLAGQGLNVVVILTDDQRWDTLQAMPTVAARLVAEGVSFENAYITTPLCSPARASLLSGGHYPHDTRVLTNNMPNGSWRQFTETNTLAEQVQAAGYATGFVGKYMNDFTSIYAGGPAFVPPGWDYFLADAHTAAPTPSFYDTRYFEAGQHLPAPGYVKGRTFEYETEFATSKALTFIDSNADEPFFLLLSYHAPHLPVTDENQMPEDLTLFQDFLYRDRGWAEADTSDKSTQPRELELPGFVTNGALDEFTRGQLRLLQPADRGIARILQRLEDLRVLDNTVIIFLSDNGYMWGEHNLFRKTHAFEESVRTPLVVRAPGVRPGVRSQLIPANLDVPATVLEIAGAPLTGQGVSLVDQVTGRIAEPTESQVFIENYALPGGNPYIWNGVIRRNAQGTWKLVNYQNGEDEFYDLSGDPFELTNIAGTGAHPATRMEMQAALNDFKRIAILDRSVPSGSVGIPYSHALQWWGPTATPTFELSAGSLPAGMNITPAGVISGVPGSAGVFPITITAFSNRLSLIDDLPLSHAVELDLEIIAP